MAALSDRDRLSDLLSESYLATRGGWGPVADKLLAAGVTVPPAPVDPAWMDSAVEVVTTATEDRGVSRAALRELLVAGYRVIPPTQDRAAVIEKATRAIVLGVDTPLEWLDKLYDAGLLVEGDGR